MSTKSIKIKNFVSKKKTPTQIKKLFNLFESLINSDNKILSSMDKSYKDSYTKKLISSLKNIANVNLIGMGGSTLGAKAIYNFLESKKKFNFIDNFSNFLSKQDKGKNINLIISKSGNTLETISNSNILINRRMKNVFITENKKSYLMSLASKLKAEVIHHNNFIGGRYSVLSEVGMLPAELMGFKPEKFRRLNNLLKNKQFINSLIQGVSCILTLNKNNITNSIILNYDDRSNDLFSWYQQLVAESLGKKGTGILPIISTMPKDNHSLMQLYLDGPKNNFFTFFYVREKKSPKIIKNKILPTHNYLKNKDLDQIIYAQKIATESVFLKQKIPFRSFEILSRDEKVLGELFCFFILETILIGRALKINPYDQPSVELIKKETDKILI